MKKKTLYVVLCLALVLVVLAACGKKEEPQPTPTPIIVYVTPEPTATPASAEPTASAEPASAEPTATPVPTATPEPTATPKPTTSGSAPTVTKSPTDERLSEGGTCLFVARADNASSITWHFVSPDGKTDVAYDGIGSYFSRLSVSGGKENTLRLSNVPADLNGWKVYCRFGNSVGSTSSGQAVVSVNAATPAPTATAAPTKAPDPTKAPEITPNPAEEPEPEPADYSGTYSETVAGRGVITISGSPSWYNVSVTWSSSANEHSTWTFSGKFDNYGELHYDDCTKITETFTEDGEMVTTTDYTNGSGYLAVVGGHGLRWNDYQEDVAADCVFE